MIYYGKGPATKEQVNIERDRRILAGFMFGGKLAQYDARSNARITGMATLAGFALAQGAHEGDLYWHGKPDPFMWIMADNSTLPMDAQTCFAFGQAAATHEAYQIFSARALKAMIPIPRDYADDSYWPVIA